ncbi:MAG: hypothetical protein KDA91_24590 [Planctomycetaceae bacterium]|nr:hypothetical protein [Planctomycetaceae bacterium]
MNSDLIRSKRHVFYSTAMILCISLFTGCSDKVAGPVRAAVAGTVTVDGAPLEEGTVVFVPTEGTSGPRVTVSVVDGRFEAAPEHGPVVGQHRVEIQSTCGPAFDDEQMVDSLAKNPHRLNVVVVPPIYNTISQLKASITEGTKNELAFDLKLPRRR